MTETTKNLVVVLSTDAEFGDQLSTTLTADGHEAVAADTPMGAAGLVASHRALVVVVGPSIDTETMLTAAQNLTSMEPAPSVIAIGNDVSTDLMRRAMRAGVHDMLSAGDQSWSEVAHAVADALSEASTRAQEQAVGPASQTRGRVVAVMGTKGGVGKSVVATNIAASLASEGQSVVLVDLDLQSGDTGIMLSLEPVHTIRDAAIASDRLDAPMLGALLTEHKSGAKVLLAPARPEDSDIVTAARVAKVLEILRDMADVVIVDTPSAWDETTLAAVDASQQILAITGMDVPSIKNTAVMLSRLKQLGRLNGTVNVVLNRADSKVLIDEKDVERALGHRVSSRVPSDRAVPRSVNMGSPIVLEAPRSAVAKALVGLTRNLTTNEV